MEPAAPQVPNADAAAGTANPDHFIHDAGTVYAGETISHAFTVRNNFDEPMSVVKEEKNCGCTSFTTSARSLSPGAETKVTVSLNTVGRDGRIEKGGRIHWATRGGEQRTTAFQLRSDVLRPLETEPAHLRWSDSDVAEGRTKNLSVHSRVPIVWKNLSANASEPFRVVELRRNEAGGAIVTLGCEPADDQSYPEGRLELRAQVRADAPALANETVTAWTVLHAENPIEFSILPKTLPLRFESNGSAHGRLLVRAARRFDASDIEMVDCPDCDAYHVTWTYTPTLSNIGTLDVHMEAIADNNTCENGTFRVQIAGRPIPRRIAFVAVLAPGR